MSSTQRLTRQQLGAALREHGFPVSNSTLNKLCAPALNIGPRPAAWFGRRPLYDLDTALAWAESRLASERAKAKGLA